MYGLHCTYLLSAAIGRRATTCLQRGVHFLANDMAPLESGMMPAEGGSTSGDPMKPLEGGMLTGGRQHISDGGIMPSGRLGDIFLETVFSNFGSIPSGSRITPGA